MDRYDRRQWKNICNVANNIIYIIWAGVLVEQGFGSMVEQCMI